MTEVPIPENYGSLEDLANWLRVKMPHEEHWGSVARWDIISSVDGGPAQWIRFQNPADATLFTLIWPR